MEKCQCSQCGSTEFGKEGKEFLRCVHCNSLFRMLPPANPGKPGGKVIIGKGANVTFGSSGNVVIRGELIIENGANVSFLGKLEGDSNSFCRRNHQSKAAFETGERVADFLPFPT
jgi:hypothetical protein